MAYLEKIIEYSSAKLMSEDELLISEDGVKIQLKPLGGLIFLCHFDQAHIGFMGAVKEAISDDFGFGLGSHLANQAKFGTTGLYHIGNWGAGATIFHPPKEMINSSALTVDFWAKFESLDTSGKERYLVDRYQNGTCSSWAIYLLDGELGVKLDTQSTNYTFQTSGLSLQTGVWYHIRFAFDQASGEVVLFLDGSEVISSSFSGNLMDSNEPQKMCPLNCLCSNVAQNTYLDELRIFNQFFGEEFTPPSQPTKPFSTSQPKAVISLDAGFDEAVWMPSTLIFFDETDFSEGGIKLRIYASSFEEPAFSGELLSLEQVRALAPLCGRWLHIEFTFISDGDTQRTLTSGKIGIKPRAYAITRRKPEIIRKL